MKLPEYVTTEHMEVNTGIRGTKPLPPMSFVRPLDIKYVPKHIISDPKFKDADMKEYGFFYTHHGIILLPKSKVRKI